LAIELLFQSTTGYYRLASPTLLGYAASRKASRSRTLPASASPAYCAEVNKLKFQVSGRAYTALISGLAYRIYYTPASKTLMSIEPIGGEQV
jgi:hypothetical protein